jgi:hypothetical protein
VGIGIKVYYMGQLLKYFVDSREHPPVPVHADLDGEHILLARDSGSVVGILDFTDVQLGYPSTDIAGLAISVRTTMAVRASLGASYPKSVVKAVYLARCNTVLLLDMRLNGDDDSPEELVEIANDPDSAASYFE